MAAKRSKEWLIENAVLAYLHHYPDNTWTQPYKELLHELRNPNEVRKRGRPAKRQRQAKASKDTASESQNETANPQTFKE